jgi:hypothetical protein
MEFFRQSQLTSPPPSPERNRARFRDLQPASFTQPLPSPFTNVPILIVGPSDFLSGLNIRATSMPVGLACHLRLRCTFTTLQMPVAQRAWLVVSRNLVGSIPLSVMEVNDHLLHKLPQPRSTIAGNSYALLRVPSADGFCLLCILCFL